MSYSPPLAYYLRRKKTRPGGLLDSGPTGGSNGVPANAVVLNGQPVTLDSQYITKAA